MRIALESVGVATIALLGLLLFRNSNEANAPLSLPPLVFALSEDSSQLFVTGTWAALDQQIAWPDQVTSFQCLKAQLVCWTATAVVADKQQLMPVNLEPLQVLTWGNGRVVATGSSGLCNKATYIFDLDAKSAQMLIEPHVASDGCNAALNSRKQLIMVDGELRNRPRL